MSACGHSDAHNNIEGTVSVQKSCRKRNYHNRRGGIIAEQQSRYSVKQKRDQQGRNFWFLPRAAGHGLRRDRCVPADAIYGIPTGC